MVDRLIRRDETGPARTVHMAARIMVVAATGAAVLAVHGTSLGYPLFYDDYSWLALSDEDGWLVDALIPDGGASIYRPGVALWFAGMKAVFGVSALPYHLVALGFLVGAALVVRWLGLELGLGNVAATATGILYGASAPLTLTTVWASAAGSSLAVALAVGSVALVCRRGARRQLGAVVMLAAAILIRDVTVVTPALAVLVLVARSPNRRGVTAALAQTWRLWLVAAAYVALRAAFGAVGAGGGAYTIDFIGGHMMTNLTTLMMHASRFGLTDSVSEGTPASSLLRAWDVIFWLSIFGAGIWALRRRFYLPLAGIAWFFVALAPVLVLRNHPMGTYYLDMATAGLALTLGSLISMVRLASAVTGVAVGAFVLAQAGAVQVWQVNSYFGSVVVERGRALQEIAATQRPRGGELVVATHCARDREFSRRGDLFRVLRSDPELRVRFELVQPESCG